MRATLAPAPEAALGVVRALQAAGHEAYFVGGCVRDRMLGREVGDWDVATNALPEVVLQLFPRTVATGLQHGTVTVVSDRLPVEVTTFRVEKGYSDGRRPDEVLYTRALDDDLGRRDFTINAMAWDPVSETLVDPHDGVGDLGRRLIRAVGDPVARFTEDGLRQLRALRFACVLDLTLDPETWAAIPQTLDTFRKVSVERIRVEFEKMLRAPRASWGLQALRDTKLLEVFLPELLSADSAESSEGLDVFPRMVAALGRAPAGLVPRLAVLLHGGAPSTDAVAPLRRLRFSNAEVAAVAHLLTFRDVHPDESRGAPGLRRLVARIGRDALDDLAGYRSAWDGALVWGDFLARVADAGARQAPHAPKELAIGGREVMEVLGEAPSRRIGEILRELLERVWDEPHLNEGAALKKLVLEVAASLGPGKGR